MSDEYDSTDGLSVTDAFTDLDLYGIAALVDGDHSQLGTLRKQAGAWRALAALLDRHRQQIDGDTEGLRYNWTGPGAQAFSEEASAVPLSMGNIYAIADGNAIAIDRWIAETDRAKSDVDKIRSEWEALNAAYGKDPHAFDGFDPNYPKGGDYVQAMRREFDQDARERMTTAVNEYEQANYVYLDKPEDYRGPTYAQEPVRKFTGDTGGSSSGGTTPGTSTSYGSTYVPPSSSGSSPASTTPAPTPSPTTPTPGPAVEFPTPTPAPVVTPTGAPGVITPTQPLPGPGGPGAMPPVPGYIPRPTGVPGLAKPGTGVSPFASRPGARTTPAVLGQRAGTGGAGTARTTGKATNPRRPGRNGVIGERPSRKSGKSEGPRGRAGTGKNTKKRPRRDWANANPGDGIENLFAVRGLMVEPVIEAPEPVRPVKRSDAGPVYGRKPWTS